MNLCASGCVFRRARCIIDMLLACELGATHARYTHAIYLVLRQLYDIH